MSLASAAMLMISLAVSADPVLNDYSTAIVGSFTSAAQSREDERYDAVEAEVVRIWPDRTDGIWIYQEQAIVGGAGAPQGASKNRPYFQRIGHIRRLPDGRLRRDNYVLKDPRRFVGLGRLQGTPEPRFEDLGSAGCHNIIERVAQGHYVGRTEGCRNSYKGAVTMTSIAITTPERYLNWDRGFDAAGKRLWGPESGGYVFDKLKR